MKHWIEPEPLLAEAARVLEPGGLFAIFGYSILSLETEDATAILHDYHFNTLGKFWFDLDLTVYFCSFSQNLFLKCSYKGIHQENYLMINTSTFLLNQMKISKRLTARLLLMNEKWNSRVSWDIWRRRQLTNRCVTVVLMTHCQSWLKKSKRVML